MKSTVHPDALSNVYERVLASVGLPLPLTVAAIDSACVFRAARQYCECLFLPEPARGMIAGGFVRDSLLGVAPNDLDFYAPRDECATLAARLEMADWQLRAAHGVLSTWSKDRKSVQLIEFSGNAAACIRRFDLTICCVALDLQSRDVICADAFISDLAARRLVIHDPALPIDTMRRVARFVRHGFTICGTELRELKRRIDLERLPFECRGARDERNNNELVYPCTGTQLA